MVLPFQVGMLPNHGFTEERLAEAAHKKLHIT